MRALRGLVGHGQGRSEAHLAVHDQSWYLQRIFESIPRKDKCSHIDLSGMRGVKDTVKL
jgi:hypothetical protein